MSASIDHAPDREPRVLRELLWQLWREDVRQHLPRLIVAVVLMTIEGSMLGLAAYLIRPLFDLVLSAEGSGGVAWVGFAIAGVFVVRAVAGYAQRLILVSIGLKVMTEIQRRLVGHLLTLDLRFFQDNPPGALIERVRGDTLTLQSIASSALMSLGRDMVALISLLVVMFANDWRWALLAMVGVPVLVLPMLVLQRLVRSNAYDARRAAAQLSTQLDEIFHGIQSIKVNRLENLQNIGFSGTLTQFLRRALRAERSKSGTPALVDLISAVGLLAVILFGGQEVASGEKSVGEFMSFFTAMALVLDPFRRLSALTANLQAGAASLERLYELFDAEPDIRQPPNPQSITSGDLRLEDVEFSYDRTPVLRGVSLLARRGQTTALVGPSGAGKTTVFALLTRLVDPVTGKVTLGGTATTELDLDALRDSIAVVGQEASLFDETIAENIRMGRLDAGPEEIRAAAEAASVLEFSDRLPDGLETRVGPRGSALSGGQRQRVAIARAMLRDAPILLMDEPTSALDSESEKLIQAALARLSEGRTTLIIAHRLSTIQDADHIVVLDQGRVIEEGDHALLMAKDGAYARMKKLQSAGVSPLI